MGPRRSGSHGRGLAGEWLCSSPSILSRGVKVQCLLETTSQGAENVGPHHQREVPCASRLPPNLQDGQPCGRKGRAASGPLSMCFLYSGVSPDICHLEWHGSGRWQLWVGDGDHTLTRQAAGQ